MYLHIMAQKLGLFIVQWLIQVSLTEALASVGFRCIGLPWDLDSNPKMETDRADKDRPRIQVVDYLYKHPTILHSNLQDSSPIIISGV